MYKEPLNRIIQANQMGLAALEGNLLSAAKGTGVKALFFTSCRAKEGKTTAAVTVAHSLASQGNQRVLLADGSLRTSSLNEVFGIDEGTPGLTDYLLSKAPLEKVSKSTEVENLTVIPKGTGLQGNSVGAVFGSDNFKAKLEALKEKYDYVIFDGDAVFSSSNAALLARHFDGVVFAVEYGKTKWEVLRLANQKMVDVGGRVLGVVLNKREYRIPRGLYEKI